MKSPPTRRLFIRDSSPDGYRPAEPAEIVKVADLLIKKKFQMDSPILGSPEDARTFFEGHFKKAGIPQGKIGVAWLNQQHRVMTAQVFDLDARDIAKPVMETKALLLAGLNENAAAAIICRAVAEEFEVTEDLTGSKFETGLKKILNLAEIRVLDVINVHLPQRNRQHPGPQKSPAPVIRQYLDVKADHPDALLLYRIGDYYELFFADAERAADLLDIPLSHHRKHAGKPVPMAGVPAHCIDQYVDKLVQQGAGVALCQRARDASGTLQHRIRVVTPAKVAVNELV